MGNSPHYRWQAVPTRVPCWHIHHDKLLEMSTEPLDKRAQFIRAEKPVAEVETRLRLMAPVRGTLPPAVVKAGAALYTAWDAYHTARWSAINQKREACDKAWDALDTARAAWREAIAAHQSEINALHAIECPNCPWDGRTIFPESRDT